MTDRPLYNSRIISTFVRLVEKKHPKVDLNRVLSEAGIERYQISDEGHWFTQPQADLFMERLVQATGNPGLAREAGQLVATAESLGTIRKYLIGLIGPVNAFNAVKMASATLTRSSSYRSEKVSATKVEITVTPHAGTRESPYQCENRFGTFEAILAMFNCSPLAIEHPECMFRGDPCCRYLVSWKQTLHLRVRTLRNYCTLAALASCALIAPFRPWDTLTLLLPGWAALVFAVSCLTSRLERTELYGALASLKETTDELLEQTGVNYSNAVMVNEVGQAISKQAGIGEVLENVTRALENRLSYDRGLILLADPEKSRLSFRIGFGYSDPELALLRDANFNLANPDSKGIFVTCFREQRPVLIDDFSQVAGYHSPRSQEFAEQMEARSFLCCPIVCEGESLGILAVDNIRSNKPLLQSDLSLMMGIAPVIGISLSNANYIERERQRAEQMRQSQKMEAVGQLAGGIAHDFNNLLTAIIGFTSLAQLHTERGSDAFRYLDEAMVASERASHLTSGLLAFSRKQTIHQEPADLNEIVSGIEKLLRRLMSEEIELVLCCGRERLPVVADAGQIGQIVMNLATNARDAMQQCGRLTIETRTVLRPEDTVTSFGPAAAGSYACLSVSDTGNGMDETTKAHIFEPFFTTKEVGKGTGLGLAIVYGIVQQHGGFIEIESTPGAGTTFAIYFPLLNLKAVRRPAGGADEQMVRGSGTVLVAEDASEVRQLTREVLESHGYRVIEAVDGADVVEKFREHRDQVQLVIMDVIMPKLNGKEAFLEIEKIRPGTRILFTSGYTPDDVLSKGVHFGRDNFLAKPCSPRALLKMVGELMETIAEKAPAVKAPPPAPALEQPRPPDCDAA